MITNNNEIKKSSCLKFYNFCSRKIDNNFEINIK
jgi:hypothetical protein